MIREKLLENWRTLLLVIAVINLVILNVVVVKGLRSKKTGVMETDGKRIEADRGSFLESEPVVTPALLPTGVLDSCGPVCQERIAAEVARAMATVSGEKVVEKTTVVREISGESGISGKSAEQAKVVYVPLVASASNTKTDWTDVSPSEFYFDLSSYPGAKTVRFTSYLRAVHATGPVYVRLYDASNLRGVDNSDFSTSSNSFERFESGPLSIWRGNNLYRVQLRSPTATEAQLSEAKLKVEWQ